MSGAAVGQGIVSHRHRSPGAAAVWARHHLPGPKSPTAQRWANRLAGWPARAMARRPGLKAALGLHPHAGQVEIFADRHPAGGNQHRVDLSTSRAPLAMLRQTDCAPGEPGPSPLRAKQARHGCRILAAIISRRAAILAMSDRRWHHPIEGLDHRDPHSQGGVDVRAKFQRRM